MAEQVYRDKNAPKGPKLMVVLVPKHYELRLKPDFNKFTFEGTVKIEFEKAIEVSYVYLHASELKISEGYANNKNHPLKEVVYNDNYDEVATLKFYRVGEIESIFLKFSGVLNDKMKGFYRTSFKLENQLVYAAVTQFEATFARRCFPCWDEPRYKATFSVTLVHPKKPCIPNTNYHLVPLSNMPIICQTPGDTEDEVASIFETTPIMSTYLLAFAIGPFEYIEEVESNRTIRVYTTPGKKEQGRYALEVTSKALTYYEQYFDVPYPLPKMDLLALPDLSFYAMENWGLLTYRESALLVHSDSTSSNARQDVALTVAHELAHQWFGNLVTMEWWTYLWLNEGFATFMEFLCVDHIFPEYQIWPQFFIHDFAKALDLDSLHNSHPIQVQVTHSPEIDEIFDDISYSKGAALIRMLHHYIGDECFRIGMRDYLTRFAHKNAVTEDLWDCLGLASKRPIREIMSRWISQTGYPWLSIIPFKEDNKTKMMLTQTRFTADGKLSSKEGDRTWIIPISATNSNGASVSVLLGTKSGSLSFDELENGWIKLNPGHIGFYRTVYPAGMSTKLYRAILDQSLPPIDRLGIQNDFFALCQAGKVSSVDMLELLEAYKSETDFNVWCSINKCLGKLHVLLSNTDYLHKFNEFKLKLFSKLQKSVNWNKKPNESHTDKMLRVIVINSLITSGDQRIISEGQKKFKAYLNGTETIPVDLRGAVFKCVSIHGDDSSFDQLFELYKTCDSQAEKLLCLTSLASTRKGPRLDRVVDLILSNDVRNQDKIDAIFPIGFNNPPVAWKMLKDNKDMFSELYGSGILIGPLVKSCIENFATEEMAIEVEKFFKKNQFAGAERAVQQSLETIKINAAWLKRDSDVIKVFFYSN